MGIFDNEEIQVRKPRKTTQEQQYDAITAQLIYIRRAIYYVALVISAFALLGVLGETKFVWEWLGISSEDYLWFGYLFVFLGAVGNFWTADKKSKFFDKKSMETDYDYDEDDGY